jgi:cytochrome b
MLFRLTPQLEPNQLVIPALLSSLPPSPVATSPPLHWDDYVASLPKWEQFLLQHVTICDRTLLFHSLRTASQLFLASDGGAADLKGSFGYVLATDDTILAECGGFVEGADPKSFRAEGYGLLAILRLVFHLRWFYITRNFALRFTLYSDSESLLKRLKASLSLTYPVPRCSRSLPRDRHQAASGIQALLTAMLAQVHTVWLLRNEHLHGTDPFQQRSYKRLHLLAQIRELYDAAPLMLANDRDILSLPFDRRYTQTTDLFSADILSLGKTFSG